MPSERRPKGRLHYCGEIPSMQDPEITAIERAIVDDPKIEDFLRILLKLTNISGGQGRPEATDFVPDGGRLAEGFPLADTRLLPHDMERLHDRFSRIVGVVLEKDPKGTDEVIRFYSDREIFPKPPYRSADPGISIPRDLYGLRAGHASCRKRNAPSLTYPDQGGGRARKSAGRVGRLLLPRVRCGRSPQPYRRG